MTSRLNESPGKNCSPRSESRPNQVSMTSQPEEEGCPVIEESGTVCGETRTLNIFQEFRQIYDECIRRIEGNKEENSALRKLAPFRKLVEDLWEQNAILVETVQELEQEATCRVAVLQNKLDQCCQKVAENLKSMNEVVNEYLEDIDSLVEVIRRFREKGVVDSSGLKFNTVCDFEIHGHCKSSCSLVKGTRKKGKDRDISEDAEKYLTTERDTPRDGNDICPSKNSSELGRSVSCQSDIPFNGKGSVHGKDNSMENCKCFGGQEDRDCDDGELFGTPSDDLSLESLLRETCELIEADQSKSMAAARSNFKSDDSGIAEIFHSAEDCRRATGKDEEVLVKASSDKCLQSTQDVENLLKQKDREISCLTKELSGKDELLGKYYSQIDDLKRDMKARSRKYQQMLNRLKDAAVQRLSKLPEGDLKFGDDCDEGAIEILFNTILREMDSQKLRCAKRIEESNCSLKEMSREMSQILNDKTAMSRNMEDLVSENCALKNELDAYKNVSSENEGLIAKLSELSGERDRLLEKVHNLHHNIQELDRGFKETRWALTSEVAEKHDQIQELRRHLACLEEQVRQADMKALFKDDVIKEMRKELKNNRTTGRRGINNARATCPKGPAIEMISDTDPDRKRKKTSFNCPNDESDGSDSIAISAQPGTDNLSIESFYEGSSPSGKLECLKNALKMKIKQMQTQDEVLRELECQLAKAKKDLACLKDRFNGGSYKSLELELGKEEEKLKDYKDVLMCVVVHMEKILGNVSSCRACKECICKRLIGDESRTIECVKKDLESLNVQLKKCEGNESEAKDFKRTVKWKALNLNDVEDFRVKAVTGVATLEEIKEQIDILHGIIKNYYSKLPCDYEKGEIEECEKKISNLHLEFDEVTDGLCTMIESYDPVQSDGSDSFVPSVKKSISNPIRESNLPGKITELQCEQKRLQREISDQESKLSKIRSQIKEVERALDEKKVLFAEKDKDIKSRDGEISRLRNGVKSFRESLKSMQIDIADNTDGTAPVPSSESSSNLSILSVELQELCEILTSSQASFPGIIEKCKEENYMMKKEINCLETCLRNKDESLAFLQESLKMREGQVEDLNCKIQCLDAELEKVRQIVEEKNGLICNLEDSARKAKEFEMRIKDENIEELQIEVCNLDYKLKSVTKEVVKKGKELDVLQDEILYVSSKNFFLTRDTDLLELKVGKLQKNLTVYEKMVCMLQKELNNRECEIEQLYDKVKDLEQELECEVKKFEKKAEEDLECINELNGTVRNLQNELDCLRRNAARASSARSSRSGEKRSINQTQENPCSNPDSESLDDRSITEGKIIGDRSNRAGNECKTPKPANLGNVNEEAGGRQELCNHTINELQKVLKETVTNHEWEKKRLVEKLCKEENENMKNKRLVSKLNECIQKSTATENSLKDIIKRLRNELEAIRCENEGLRREIEDVRENMRRQGLRGNFDEMDKLISDLEAQKTDLKIKCRGLKSELDNEERIKRSLEDRIKCLNDSLANKTLQCNELFQNYKCKSAKAEEALTKLKEAEDRLKCMKMEMNTFRVCDEEEEEEEDGENEAETAREKCVEELLEAKKRECSDLINEIDCLKMKLKALQGEYISALAKDSELMRVNGEVSRLESELNVFEKENCKLRNDVRKAQDELKNRLKVDDDFKDELDRKDKELCEIITEKKSLLVTIDDLHERLEKLCLDSNRKEKENSELMNECSKLKKELSKLESELRETRHDLSELKNEYSEAVKTIKCTEKKMLNFKKLYNRVNEENANLQETRSKMERDLREARTENIMLKEKIMSAKKQKDVETKKLMAENSNAAQEKIRYCTKIKELTGKIKNLEENVIPHLEDEIIRKERCIENYKMELQDANSSSQRMRDESLRVIQCTKKYLTAQKCANDGLGPASSDDGRRYANNETRELEEQLKTVTRLNEHLYFELQNVKNDYQDIEPRSFSPLPWGCSNVERDNSSPEYGPESGFQSMQQSPTNYMHDYNLDGKRKSSQWNTNVGRFPDNNDYSPCRNNSVR